MISDLVTNEARFLKKKEIRGPNLVPTSLNQARNEVFCHFLEFGSLVFLEITYSDSFQQFLESSRGKSQEKKCLAANLWVGTGGW